MCGTVSSDLLVGIQRGVWKRGGKELEFSKLLKEGDGGTNKSTRGSKADNDSLSFDAIVGPGF